MSIRALTLPLHYGHYIVTLPSLINTRFYRSTSFLNHYLNPRARRAYTSLTPSSFPTAHPPAAMSDSEGSDAHFDVGSDSGSDGYRDSPQPKKAAPKKAAASAKPKAAAAAKVSFNQRSLGQSSWLMMAARCKEGSSKETAAGS